MKNEVYVETRRINGANEYVEKIGAKDILSADEIAEKINLGSTDTKAIVVSKEESRVTSEKGLLEEAQEKYLGEFVEVEDNSDTCAFVGQCSEVKENEVDGILLTVCDQESNCFDVELKHIIGLAE